MKVYARLGGIYQSRPDKLFYPGGWRVWYHDTLSLSTLRTVRINVERYKPLAVNTHWSRKSIVGWIIKQSQSLFLTFLMLRVNDFSVTRSTCRSLTSFGKRHQHCCFLRWPSFNPSNLYTTARKWGLDLNKFCYNGPIFWLQENSWVAILSTVDMSSVLGQYNIAMYNDQSRNFSRLREYWYSFLVRHAFVINEKAGWQRINSF